MAAVAPTVEPDTQGTHVLGQHAWLTVQTGRACQPDTSTPEQAWALIQAVCQCIDLVGGNTQASKPKAAAPEKLHVANRDRSSSARPETALARPLPMNPVQGHHASAGSRAPQADSDSRYWLTLFLRSPHHFDRCEVVRRAADYLAGLIRRDPNADAEAEKRRLKIDADERLQVLVEGDGHPIEDVARRFRMTVSQVARIRIAEGRNPANGKMTPGASSWVPPEDRDELAAVAREWKAAGINSTDSALALGVPARTVRRWTTPAPAHLRMAA